MTHSKPLAIHRQGAFFAYDAQEVLDEKKGGDVSWDKNKKKNTERREGA